METKLIIFDFDGTLFANQYSHKKILSNLMSKKYDLSEEEILNSYNSSEIELEKFKEFSSIEEFYKKFNILFLKKLNLNYDENSLEEFSYLLKEMRKTVKMNSIIYPHVYDTLISLKEKGFKLAILSGAWEKKIKEISQEHINRKLDRVYEILKNNNLINLFDRIFICWENGIFKPDKEAFTQVLEHFNVLPREAIMVGDEIYDMAASNFGIKTILFNPENKYSGEIKPNYEFKDYLELENIISNL